MKLPEGEKSRAAGSEGVQPVALDTSTLPPAPAFTSGPDARRGADYGGYGSSQVANHYGDGGVHFMDYVRVLYKRRWIAIAVFMLILGSVTLHNFTATPLYEARAQVLIEKEEANIVNFQQVVEENRQTLDYYQTQYRILQSRALARRALTRGDLWDQPAFRTEAVSPGLVQRAVSMVRSVLSDEGNAGGEVRGIDETPEQANAVDRYLGMLRVNPIRNSRLVEVGFVTPNAEMSARLANLHAQAYIDHNLEFKFMASKEAADWLSDRMGEQRKQVEAAEQALQQYREQTGAVALEDRQNIVVQRLADLNAAVTRARTERIEKEAVYNQIRQMRDDRAAIDTVPAILTNVFIQQQRSELAALQRQKAQMSEKLGVRHPDMVKVTTAIEEVQTRIDGEVQRVVLAMKNEYQAALSNERSLQAALDQQRQEAQELNRASIQYDTLQRNADANRQVFQGLLQRTKETGVSTELRANNIRVVDAAQVPRSPSSPNRRDNTMMGILAGLVLAVGTALVFEHLDGRIKSPEEIKSHLGLPCLGMVPITKEAGKSDPLLSGDAPHIFAEAVKSIRTNLLFSSAEDSCKAVVITSTGPSEGKTVVAGNLAIALAQSGQRVLLMDCDMRRPRVHSLLNQPQEPGLSDLMVGHSKTADCVRKSGTNNLWVLPAGKNPPNPAELLGSRRFREFLVQLRPHFDWVILDSPPVMAVTDSVVIAHNAQGVVFVVGAEMTHRSTARTALEHLESGKAKFFGAVLNKVNLQRHGYYYSAYARPDYAKHYASEST